MNKTMKMLYNEHEIITGAIDAAKQMKSFIGKDNLKYASTVRLLINFFRNYADKYHHFKEEEILFPEMNKRNELLSEGVIKEMLENHEEFRAMIKDIENSLDENNYTRAQQYLQKYTEALLDHIAVENDEVFQTAESIFTDDELEKIGFRFLDCDSELGENKKEELENLSGNLRRILHTM